MKSRAKPLQKITLTENLVGLSKPTKVEVTARTVTLRGVRFLGLESKNGRRYSAAAAKAAIPLYEGAKINADHPDKPRDRRSSYDRLGNARNVIQGADGGLYGDAILLRRHPRAVTKHRYTADGAGSRRRQSERWVKY